MGVRQSWSRFTAVLLSVILLSLLLAIPVRAAGQIDPARQGSLTVHFGQEDTGFPDVTFRLYYVASISSDAALTLAGDFSAYPVTFDGLSTSEWRALAQTLAGYAARDDLPPLQTAQTNADGDASFPLLPTGLYLVVGDTYSSGPDTYTPEAFLVSLPNADETTGDWVYDVTAHCKYDVRHDEPQTVSRQVIKLWDDADAAEHRPAQIVVQLLRDGQVYDTVTLDKGNDWQYTWTELDAGSHWQVTEYDTPEGYSVLVSQEGAVFIMTNRYHEDVPTPSPSPSPTPSAPTPSPSPTFSTAAPSLSPTSTPIPTPTATGKPPILPQTGMLWWPVPVLACGGMLLFLIGWIRRRKHDA